MTRAPALRVAFALGLVAAVAPSACDRNRNHEASRRAEPGGSCAAGQRQLPGRSGRIRALLETTPAGRDLVRRAPRPLVICYGKVAGGTISADGTILLDEMASEPESAARLGHLLLHAVSGTTAPEDVRPSDSCRAVVERLLMDEARAHALELELRRDLHVTRARLSFPFAQAFWAAPSAKRVELIRTYLTENSGRTDGVPDFLSAYMKRCGAQGLIGDRLPA